MQGTATQVSTRGVFSHGAKTFSRRAKAPVVVADTAYCYCPSDMPYGRLPPEPAGPIGGPLQRAGRPMGHLCQPMQVCGAAAAAAAALWVLAARPCWRHHDPLLASAQTPEGKEARNWGDVPRDFLFNETGWCVAENPSWQCVCLYDGLGGRYCNMTFEMFCPNQCNGTCGRVQAAGVRTGVCAL